MPNYNWSPRSKAREVFIARDDKGITKLETKGTHMKCRRCLLFETCENVLYKAEGRGLFYCADNPKERRKDDGKRNKNS